VGATPPPVPDPVPVPGAEGWLPGCPTVFCETDGTMGLGEVRPRVEGRAGWGKPDGAEGVGALGEVLGAPDPAVVPVGLGRYDMVFVWMG
jgi:hypothetical protein